MRNFNPPRQKSGTEIGRHPNRTAAPNNAVLASTKASKASRASKAAGEKRTATQPKRRCLATAPETSASEEFSEEDDDMSDEESSEEEEHEREQVPTAPVGNVAQTGMELQESNSELFSFSFEY